jgi:Fe-S cluster biogenesis protein NfuA
MSTGASESDEPTAATLRNRVASTLDREFPRLRGGKRVVQRADPDTGIVTLSFSCGCSDGVSKSTERAIENTLVTELDNVTGITTESGCGCGPSDSKESDDTGPKAPF